MRQSVVRGKADKCAVWRDVSGSCGVIGRAVVYPFSLLPCLPIDVCQPALLAATGHRVPLTPPVISDGGKPDMDFPAPGPGYRWTEGPAAARRDIRGSAGPQRSLISRTSVCGIWFMRPL